MRIRGARAGCACLRLYPLYNAKGRWPYVSIKLRLPLLTMLILFVAATGGASRLRCCEVASRGADDHQFTGDSGGTACRRATIGMGTVAQSRLPRLFIAQLGCYFGTWMQTVAVQWFLVERHSSDVIVALVQTASLGPTLLLGLLAGVLADLFDRRRLLIFLQSYAVLVALALAVLTYLGRLGPTSLLIFTVAIGCASALTGPAWQAIQPEVVPREQIPAASTLGSVAGNAARAIGPALGGLVVALAGAAAVFAINAVSFVGVIVALVAWKRPKQSAPIEREHRPGHHHRTAIRS